MLKLIFFAVCFSSCMGIDLRPYNLTALYMFTSSDTNNDGVFQRAEMDYEFEIYDTDPKDGHVSRREYTNYINQTEPTLYTLSHELYDLYDVNNDDILMKEDYDNFFSLMDGDADGLVSEQEFVRYWSILLESLEHLIESGGISRRENNY